jgi:hypothetical protein
MCAVLGHHGEISARDDRVSAVMDALYGCDHKPVYAAHQAQPIHELSAAADKVVISNATGNPDLYRDAVAGLISMVRALAHQARDASLSDSIEWMDLLNNFAADPSFDNAASLTAFADSLTMQGQPSAPSSDQTWNDAIEAAAQECEQWNATPGGRLAARLRTFARPSQAHFEEQPDGTITPVDPADMGISILDFRPSQAQEPAAGCTTCPHVVGDAYQRDCAYPDCTPSGAQPVSGAVMMSAHSLCPTDMPHPERMRWIADYFLKHYQPVTQPVSGAVDAADIDSLALNAARQIMGIVNGSWLPGGAPWVQARIQEIVATFLEVPAFSRAQQAPAVSDGFNGDNAKLCDCIDALLDLDAKGVLVPHGVGGHARTMLSAAATRLRAALSQPAAAPVSEQTTQEKSC